MSCVYILLGIKYLPLDGLFTRLHYYYLVYNVILAYLSIKIA